MLGGLKLLPRFIANSQLSGEKTGAVRLLIVGAGTAGAMLASRLIGDSRLGYRVMGFVDDDPAKWSRRMHGQLVWGSVDTLPKVVADQEIDLIAIAIPSASPERTSQIITLCQETSAAIRILPGLREMVGDMPITLNLREVNVADLLGREVIPLRLEQTHAALEGKIILVTGGAGSIGSELCRQLITYSPARVIALDNNETGLFDLAASLTGRPHSELLQLQIGDLTDRQGLARIFEREHPQVVFHAAAYKHVPLLEAHPDQAIRVNVLGTYDLAQVAREYEVEHFVFVSSDKAADPINMLGASKRMGELITLAMAGTCDGVTRYCAVRFGNVIGSRGSVVPTFARQIEMGGPVTVTDPEMTRYFMTIPEACGLVIVTSTIGDSGGLYVLDMGEPVRLVDVASKMIRLRGLRIGQDIEIAFIGKRPGEKLHEALTASTEELTSTAHSKISRVSPSLDAPTVSTVDEWMQRMRKSLSAESQDALRAELLQMTLAHAVLQ
jgi:FlaA1/EpsC-like NDP-sugar epimerase